MPKLDRDAEIKMINSLYETQGQARVMELLERQFGVLHNRASALLVLCGVVVTTTGFSGRLIAGTNRLAQVLIIIGVSLVLLAVGVMAWAVMHLWWLTQHGGATQEQWIRSCLDYRDRKTRLYRMATGLLLLGLIAYVGAIAIMLLHPEAATVSSAR